MNKNFLKICGIVIGVMLIIPILVNSPIVNADFGCSACSEMLEFEDLSGDVQENLINAIQYSEDIGYQLENLSKDINDLSFYDSIIIQETGEEKPNRIVLVPVNNTTNFSAAIAYLNDTNVEETGRVIITPITEGMLINFTLGTDTVYYTEIEGSYESDRGYNGVVLSYNSMEDGLNESFWDCWLNCMQQIVFNPLCIIPCWECFYHGNAAACFICSACTVGAGFYCALKCTVLSNGAVPQSTAYALMSPLNDCYTTNDEIYEMYVYSQSTSELIAYDSE